MCLVDPLAGEIHQRREIALGAERLRLEPADFTGRSGLLLRLAGSASHDVTHRGIDAQPLGIVDIFTTCQSAVNRLPQQRHELVLLVATLARIGKHL